MMNQREQAQSEKLLVGEKPKPDLMHQTMTGVAAPGAAMTGIAAMPEIATMADIATMAAIATIVVGLGNPILGDDGVGWHVAEQVHETIQQNPPPGQKVVVEFLSLGGLSLMEHLIGYDRAIIIDAIDIGDSQHGFVHCLPLEWLPDNSGGHLTAVHDTSLQTALRVGRSMGAHLPAEITVVGIESPYVYDFSEELTPPVAAAVPSAVQKVLELLYQDKR